MAENATASAAELEEEHLAGWTIDKSSSGLFLVIAVFLAVLSWSFARRYKVQPVVIMMILGAIWRALVEGIGLGAIGNSLLNWMNISNPSLLLYLFLPGLIFGGSFNADFHVFTHSLANIMWLAFPAVCVVAILQALFPVFWYGWDWPTSLSYGFMLAATDPVSVIALLHDLGAPTEVSHLMEGESIVNDGSGLVGLTVFQHAMHTGELTAGHVIWTFIRLSAGGYLWGFVTGTITKFILSRMKFDILSEVMLTAGVAWGTYLVAETVPEYMNVSGVLSCHMMGLVLGSSTGRAAISNLGTMGDFWKIVEYLSNTCIFVLTGAFIMDRAVFASVSFLNGMDVLYLFVFYIGINVIRFIAVFGSLPLMKRWGYGCTWQEATVLSYAGVRGAIALVGALLLSQDPTVDPAVRQRIIFSTCGLVALTLIINSGTIKPLVNFLKVTAVSEERQRLFRDSSVELFNEIDQAASASAVKTAVSAAHWQMINSHIKHFFMELGLSADECNLRVANVDATDIPQSPRAVERQNSIHSGHSSLNLLDALDSKSEESSDSGQKVPYFQLVGSVDLPVPPMARVSKHVYAAPVAVTVVDASEDTSHALIQAARRKLLNILKATYWSMYSDGDIGNSALTVLVDCTRRGQDAASEPLFEWSVAQNSIATDSFFGINRRTRRAFGCVPLDYVPESVQQRMLYGPLVYQYDLVSGFIQAHEAAIEVFMTASKSDVAMQTIADEVQHELEKARRFQTEIEHSYGEIVEAIKAERTLNSLMRAIGKGIERLSSSGELDDREAHRMEHALQHLIVYGSIPVPSPPTVADSMDAVGILEAMSDFEIDHLVAIAQQLTFHPNEIILSQGTHSDGFFLVLRGTVSRFHNTSKAQSSALLATQEAPAAHSLSTGLHKLGAMFTHSPGTHLLRSESDSALTLGDAVAVNLAAGSAVGVFSMLSGKPNYFTLRANGFVDCLFFPLKDIFSMLSARPAPQSPVLVTAQFEENIVKLSAESIGGFLEDFQGMHRHQLRTLIRSSRYMRPVPLRPVTVSGYVLLLTGCVLATSEQEVVASDSLWAEYEEVWDSNATTAPEQTASAHGESAYASSRQLGSTRHLDGNKHASSRNLHTTRRSTRYDPLYSRRTRLAWFQENAEAVKHFSVQMRGLALLRYLTPTDITCGPDTRLLILDSSSFEAAQWSTPRRTTLRPPTMSMSEAHSLIETSSRLE